MTTPPPDEDPFDQAQLIPRVRADRNDATRALPATTPVQPPAVEPPPDAPPRTRRRRRFWPRRILTWAGIAVGVVIGYGLLLVGLVLGLVAEVDSEPQGERPAASRATTYLLVGSDSRDNLTAEEQAELSTGSGGSRLADTIMLLYTAPDAPATLVSVPRDSYVEVPGYGMQKINAAYSFGGAPLLRQTVEQATGVRTDGYVEIGFDGFSSIVDAVGGVEICLDEPLVDPRAGIDLAAGCQTLDGADALGYVRTRYTDPDGDLGRVQRQREFLAALADQAVSVPVLANPFRSIPFAVAVGRALTLDEDMGIISTSRFGLTMVRAVGSNGVSLTVPVEGFANTPVGSVVTWDEAAAEALFAAMRAGEPVPTNGQASTG
jgi:LCP family protein required for cell wall assembly